MSITGEQRLELYKAVGSRYFPASYKNDVFMIWFNAGKPTADGLLDIINPVLGTTVKPTKKILHDWITSDFLLRAMELDKQVSVAMTEQVVVEKIEMLKRHIKLGKTMQNIAMEYLDEHRDDLNPNSAVRLLVEGIRVERESAGIPEALEKMTKMSDDELLEQIEDIIKSSPAKLEVESE